MRRLIAVLIASLGAVVLSAQTRATLDIYVVDVEGGNATLYVAPSGESLLIDTGNGGAAAARDGDRIMAAVKDAGLSRIDRLITTHYHGDHFGAMENLAGRIPIGEFIDHGPNVQPNPATDAFLLGDSAGSFLASLDSALVRSLSPEPSSSTEKICLLPSTAAMKNRRFPSFDQIGAPVPLSASTRVTARTSPPSSFMT